MPVCPDVLLLQSRATDGKLPSVQHLNESPSLPARQSLAKLPLLGLLLSSTAARSSAAPWLLLGFNSNQQLGFFYWPSGHSSPPLFVSHNYVSSSRLHLAHEEQSAQRLCFSSSPPQRLKKARNSSCSSPTARWFSLLSSSLSLFELHSAVSPTLTRSSPRQLDKTRIGKVEVQNRKFSARQMMRQGSD